MKQFLLVAATVLVTTASVQAQDFKTSLKKTFDAFETAHDNHAQQVELGNKLTLIAKKWDNEWAGHYYAAFGKTVLSYNEKDEAKRDAYLDDAEKEREDAVSLLKKENDETYVLAAMIANARLAVNPQSRWQQYGKIFSEDLESAKEINAENPRIYYLQGMSKRYTPKAFGGGKKAALPYFEKADTYFAKENSEDILKPYWGKPINTYMLADCKTEDKE